MWEGSSPTGAYTYAIYPTLLALDQLLKRGTDGKPTKV